MWTLIVFLVGLFIYFMKALKYILLNFHNFENDILIQFGIQIHNYRENF